MSASKIQTLSVSITDRHLSEMIEKNATRDRNRSSSAADTGTQVQERTRQSSISSILSCASSMSSQMLVPTLKDVKKLMKRFPQLSTLTWDGKGGPGHWQATRCLSKETTITFHSAVDKQEITKEQSKLTRLQVPDFDSVLSNLDVDVSKHTRLAMPTNTNEVSLAASGTSSSLATILSTSSHATTASTHTTVTGDSASPKYRMSPTTRTHKTVQPVSPISPSYASSFGGANNTAFPANQLHAGLVNAQTGSPSVKHGLPSKLDIQKTSQSPKTEKKVHRDG